MSPPPGRPPALPRLPTPPDLHSDALALTPIQSYLSLALEFVPKTAPDTVSTRPAHHLSPRHLCVLKFTPPRTSSKSSSLTHKDTEHAGTGSLLGRGRDHRFPSSRCSSFNDTNVSPSLYAGRCSEHCVWDGLCREDGTEERNKPSSERLSITQVQSGRMGA